MPENNNNYNPNEKNPYSIFALLGGNAAPITEAAKKKKQRNITIALSVFMIYIALLIIGSISTINSGFAMEFSPNPLKLLRICFTGGVVAIFLTALSLVLLPKLAGAIAASIVKRYETLPQEDAAGRIQVNDGSSVSEIMRDDELEKVFTLCQPDEVTNYKGYIVGVKKDTGEAIIKERGRANFREHLSNENAGAFGPAGTGKSTGCLLPNILNSAYAGEAMVIYDPKGELYLKSKGILLAQGYQTKVFITKAARIMHSDGWDCLKLVRESENPEPLAEMFSETLLKNVGGTDTPYWGPANHGLLTLCILYVAKAELFLPVAKESSDPTSGNYDKYRTFSEVIELFTSDTKISEKLISSAIGNSEHDKKLLKAKYNTWAKGEHTEQITSGLANSLSRFTTQTVSEILSADEINFEDLTEKTAFFIISDTDEETYRALAALFFNSMMYRMKSIAEENDNQSLKRMLQIYIDELPSIGRIPLFENYMKTIRSYNIGIYYIAQSIDDLSDVYGEKGSSAWVGILENTPLQLCLGANSDGTGTNTKNYFSKRSGTVTVRHKSSRMDAVTYIHPTVQEIFNPDRSITSSDKGEPVYPPDAISHIKPDEILISPATHNSVIQAKYHWEMHPLHDIMLIDKETGKEAQFLPAKHIPPRRGGDEDNMDRYIIASRREHEGRSARKAVMPKNPNAGLSEDDFV